MMHIEIPDECFEKITTIYANEINNYLRNKSSNCWISPLSIYDYLYAVRAEQLLTASLSQMDDIIGHIQSLPGWSKLGIFNCRNMKNHWNDCNNCHCNGRCNLQQANVIINDLIKYFGKIYTNWCNRIEYYSPYDFIKALNIRACPYCNLEYIQTATIKHNNNGKTKFIRPALDHFYPKSIYPYFSISLYNLIPCCTTCNTSIKRDEEIGSYIDCIHPYDVHIDYHRNIRYRLLLLSNAARRILRNHNSNISNIYNICGKWIIYDCIPPNGEQVYNGYMRAKKNFEYFGIKERIEQGYDDYITEIYEKTVEYPEEYIRDLQQQGYSLSEALRLFFVNYVKEEDINKRPLSKITHDVIEQCRPDILTELAQGEDNI